MTETGAAETRIHEVCVFLNASIVVFEFFGAY